MLLRNITIENYRSLKRVEMNNIDNLVILVGKNSSGKTNLLEALWLFFKDFSLVPETVAINATLVANEHLWFEGETNSPISFVIEIELDERESKRVFPTSLHQALSESGKFLITVERQIIAAPPNMSWKTVRLTCNKAQFIENGKIAAKVLEEEKPTNSNPSTQVSEQKKKTSARKKVKAIDARLQEQRNLLDALTPQDIQKIATSLQNEIREKVKYIQAARSKPSTPSNYAVRTATVNDITNQRIVQMGENLSTGIRRRWRRLQEDFEKFSPYGQRLNVVKSQIIVDETELSVPLYLVGGGTQEVVTILRCILEDGKPVVLIEEPESHLHPELAKKLFKYLIKLSKNTQILISTQSPFFLSRKEINDTWAVRRENNETKTLRLMDKVELKKTILDIGVKPSDVLFADAILLVEGPTEEDVIPIWGRTIGIDLDELGVSILPIRGAEKGRYHLKMWREITRSAEIPLFALFDVHAQGEANECIEQGLIERDRCVVSDVASIEENYPKKHVLKAIKDEWGIEMRVSEMVDTKVETIKNALVNSGMELEGNWWKPPLGRRVAEKMKANEIPDEIRRLIERIKLVLM